MNKATPNVQELIHVAREDMNRNRMSSAERVLEQAILLNNQEPEAFYLLGHVYSKKGKFKKAILVLEKALILDPFHTDAAIALSSLYNDMGRYEEGAAVYKRTKMRLQTIAPGHDPKINLELAKEHYQMGLKYLRYERFAEAQEEFHKAMNLDSRNPQFAVQRAKCLSKLGDKTNAVSLLQRLLDIHPKSVEAKLQLGILYHSQNNLTHARQEWNEALALDPENRSVQMYLQMLDQNVSSLV